VFSGALLLPPLWTGTVTVFEGRASVATRSVAGKVQQWFDRVPLGRPHEGGRPPKLDWKAAKEARTACLRAVIRDDRRRRRENGIDDVDRTTQKAVAESLGVPEGLLREHWNPLCGPRSWDPFRRKLRDAIDRDRAERG